ncbi:MAG: nucleoside deaminase [Solirubrobacteraceae bacterium]|nr:nucleoside deaminase [Solirubrobacteraceae bacterium]
MHAAIEEARIAEAHGDVPIGAVVVAGGEIVGRGRNERELASDPTAHAEVLALRQAANTIGDGWRVTGATLYVTLEPCTMCAGAIVLSRVPRVVFGAWDPKAGAAGSVLSVLDRPEFNHRPQVTAGVLEPECAELLRAFFRARR